MLAIVSEVGIDEIKKISAANHFCSWLKWEPNNKISRGKVLLRKIPKERNRLKITLRNAANTIGNS